MSRSVSAILRDHRLRSGLTQEALAELAGISGQAIGALERGLRRHPHQHTIGRLSEALGLSAEQRTELESAARRNGPPPETPTRGVPRQLPPEVAHFTGRETTSGELAAMLRPSPTVVVACLAGMGGVGKTSTAVHVGHLVAERFPGGQLYVDLRGSREPLPAHEALGRLMRAVGIRTDVGPDDLEEAAARFRSRLADQQVLVVLDDAASAEQVAPLLPGTAGCAALVTSRRVLDALPQARHVPLDLMSEEESVRLLAETAGRTRVAVEPDAARAVVAACGRLPLAIRLAGARLAARPAWPLGHLASRLADERRRLDELDAGESGVRACFAVSVDGLDASAARAFALLSQPELPDLSVPVAAALLDLDEAAAERTLERLADLHLLDASVPGSYRMHDLVRSYAQERAGELVSPADREDAVRRLLELFVAVAWRSIAAAAPGSSRHAWADAAAWSEPARELDAAGAVRWLDRHRGHLVQVIRVPGVPDELIVRLSLGLFSYCLGRELWLDWSRVARPALAAAGRREDRLAEALLRMDLGLALADLAQGWSRSSEEGLAQLRRSADELRAVGDLRAAASCLLNLNEVLAAAGDVDAAIACCEESLAICAELGDHHAAEAIAWGNLGVLHGRRGDRDRELAHYGTCLRISESIGYDAGTAWALRLLGAHHRAGGLLDEAELSLRRAVELSGRLVDPASQMAALEELGAVDLDRGDPLAAIQTLQAALRLAEDHGDPLREAGIRRHLGSALTRAGRETESAPQLRRAAAIYREEGVPEPPPLADRAAASSR